jgi:hypothetical protein
MRMDAKIDMLHRSGVIGKTPSKAELPSRKSGEGDARVWGSEVCRMILLYEYLPLKRPSCIDVGRK